MPDAFIERYGVNPFCSHHSLKSPDRCMEYRAQCPRFLFGQLRERLAVPVGLYDQLTGIGVATSVVTDEPESVAVDHPSRCRALSRYFGAGTTLLLGEQSAPSESRPW